MTNCPNCGSCNLSKNGRSQNRNKTQRFKCKDCACAFTPFTGLLASRPIKNWLPDDLICCKEKLWRIGYYQGKQQYRCRKCSKTYIDHTDNL